MAEKILQTYFQRCLLFCGLKEYFRFILNLLGLRFIIYTYNFSTFLLYWGTSNTPHDGKRIGVLISLGTVLFTLNI